MVQTLVPSVPRRDSHVAGFLYFGGMGFLIALLICHWAGDFTHLSRPYMLAAKKLGTPWMPIFEHAAVHGILMAVTTYLFTHNLLSAAIVMAIQTIAHFWIDLLKGKMNKWFPSLQNPANYFHWYVFGADQFLHILTIICLPELIQLFE